VLGTTTIGVVFLPIHWAVLIGLAVSVALFLRRVSRLHMFEMVRGADGPFREQELDAQTGRSLITMLQVEGPLFFAHADEIGDMLRVIFARKPQVTILRMRRTQQIDFSVIAALNRVMAEYVAAGGHVIICGLAPPMRARLADSPLRETLGSDFLLETTREVFGSAHIAIGLARSITEVDPNDPRPLFRSGAAS
jgi:SulP family sulfate permease